MHFLYFSLLFIIFLNSQFCLTFRSSMKLNGDPYTSSCPVEKPFATRKKIRGRRLQRFINFSRMKIFMPPRLAGYCEHVSRKPNIGLGSRAAESMGILYCLNIFFICCFESPSLLSHSWKGLQFEMNCPPDRLHFGNKAIEVGSKLACS